MTGKSRTQFATFWMWTAAGAIVLSLCNKSTTQLSRLAMINSESMGIEGVFGSDAKVSKQPDLEANERCEVGDLLIVSVEIGGLTCGGSGVGFLDSPFRLNANFGFVPVEVWFACSFSKACSHDFSCLNARHHQRSRQGQRARLVPYHTVVGRKGGGTSMRPRTVFSGGPIGLRAQIRASWSRWISGWQCLRSGWGESSDLARIARPISGWNLGLTTAGSLEFGIELLSEVRVGHRTRFRLVGEEVWDQWTGIPGGLLIAF